MTDDRITNIEMLLAHQEKQIGELSEMTTQQWAAIEQLKRQLSAAQDRLASMEQSSKEGAKGELSTIEIAALNKPPHY